MCGRTDHYWLGIREAPQIQTRRYEDYTAWLDANWFSLTDTDRAFEQLAHTELAAQAVHAQQFVRYYVLKYVQYGNYSIPPS